MSIKVNHKLYFVVLNILITLLVCNSSIAEAGNTNNQIGLSCLFKWKELPQNVPLVKISPEIKDSPSYPFTNPKEFYGDLPNNCLTKKKFYSKKIRIIMDDKKLMKISIVFIGDQNNNLVNFFDKDEQSRIDHDFRDDGRAFSEIKVLMDKSYNFEYLIELYAKNKDEEDKIKETLTFYSEEMFNYE